MGKVTGISGRFGARYGSTLRKKWKEIMEKRYDEHQCPYCKTTGKVIRLASGIWYCKKCNSKWAGLAYTPY
ncbi:50S ribosomal protein L37ae [Saccharolobus solfataricus]|uniref:Large ribosomal subunit protein eL43 n=4 Tax=Saccharolobus solfataricus TaxID=2287 RepID=RL37A_SACS2|nr:50S ribosomal protein L37ae [Saccharolobus solfataricus]Q97ZQ3.2 RecName: Full=Large ribosomal subunit protein eL43; AltName: Full=50S ribosomal protein L37Ae; AltName: Full=Ribosomal protein L43e [Saccharolobus solfataricus P2]AKA74057.1 50S ribosomal protein L37ae [Saccharolobus solfataricus]AKA77779.1 50S ribosomal protein L37ae [Saccharolobus solfataricus]AKA79448.1 50S ribosomal protein L37ae [Saccharolobus solfataricus]AZF68536.1 50S ribosomal protein L37ae [Saccharolobus solfataricus